MIERLAYSWPLPTPERTETPPSPLSTVPFPRDADFVSRSTILDRIREKSSVPGSRTALVGLGGVGKSKLAIEYSYQVRSKSPTTWVFWVHASNEARFEQSFREIADYLKLPGRRDPGVNIFQLVEKWLRDERKGKWVCVLDNVDDEFLISSPGVRKDDSTRAPTNAPIKPLLEYIPRSPNGSTIITSRSRDIALKVVDQKFLLEVKPMEKSEAVELLQKKLDSQGDSQESQQLVDMLEFMPLAIVQAASLIRNRISRYSISQFMSDFQKSDREATKLLRKEVGYTYRDWEAENSILVTWQISFDYIRQTRTSATDLLSLMCFFDRQGIPENLIQDNREAKRKSPVQPSVDSSDGESSGSDIGPDFEDDVATLRNYSFISVNEDGDSFMMHRLVQLSMRAWLKSHGQIEYWKEQFIKSLAKEFPSGKYGTWAKCRILYPHVKSAISQRPKSPEYLRELAELLYRGARYASESGLFNDMMEMALQSRGLMIKYFGLENETALKGTAILAEAYWNQGRWEEAEQLFVQVMESRKSKLGEDHPDTLTSMHNLALTYQDQGRWEEAEQLQVQVMETRKTKLGEDHPSTLTSMHNLASTYRQQGRWKEAEQFFVRVTETCTTKLGEDHPDTLTSMHNLASTYREQGRWKEAEQLFVQVIESRKTKLGEDHPDTLSSMHSLAWTYLNQGRWGEAEQLQVQVMGTYMMKLGEDHPNTLTSMHNLASTYQGQDRWEEAEQLQVQVMEARKTKLGEDHPDTLTSMHNLASTYQGQDRWEEAEQLQVQVMETRKTKLGEDHPSTLTSMHNLASTYRQQGRWKDAEQFFVRVMETSKTKLGEDHPHTLTSMTNLAFTWKSLGRDAQAIDLLRNCLAKQRQKLGLNHPHTLSNSRTVLVWETDNLNISS
ncbi:putative tpr domain protein [Penicillium brasilianum]|uniref:Putative tpr domain protein n=1 Tax=Penicillium brasilianum TaxID=104259 RepID=A0A1S9S183_PENBI|nr:putative tpr domain protein [Penicillium brasilianum]